MEFSLSLGTLIAAMVALGGIVRWLWNLQGRISTLETACESTEKIIQDSVKLSAQAIANLAEESREARKHIREMLELRMKPMEEAVQTMPKILERLTRIEAKQNGGLRT